MSQDLEVLVDNRDALLLAEIAAWLHMFGKFHEEFLQGDLGLNLATKIPPDIQINFPNLYSLLTTSWTGAIWNTLPIQEFKAEHISIQMLIEKHHRIKECSEGFLRLFADAHGRGSGTEKGVLAEFATPLKTIVYTSTSLGNEATTHIDLIRIQTERQHLYGFLEVQLNILKSNNANLGYDEWIRFRRDFLQRIKQSFYTSVAETRRPLNDVTLWDQTMATVGFFKAALAFNLLRGWKEPDVVDIPQKYRWRLLRIGLDGLAFWQNSTRISDILTRKKLITEALDKVNTLLEVTYPLGLEVYRDENGSVFLMPDIDDINKYVSNNETLENQIEKIALKTFAHETEFMKLSPSGNTRNTLSFGQVVTEHPSLPSSDPNWLSQIWHNQAKVQDICPVCGLRPQGPNSKTLRRKICDTCNTRRNNRSQQWFKDLSNTIWIDEVADKTGQLALITAQFDMKLWLSGTFFNTVLAFDISPHCIEKIKYKFAFNELIDDIKRGLYDKKKQYIEPSSLLEKLTKKYLEYIAKGKKHKVEELYDTRISDTDLANVSDSTLLKEKRLTLEMIRLSPSFSRVYRVWQTTQTFWKETVDNFKTSIGNVSPRLQIKGTFRPTSDSQPLAISHTYNLKIDDVAVSITYIKDETFLIVDNLQRTAKLLGASKDQHRYYADAADYVQGLLPSERSFDIEEPTGYGDPSRTLGKLHITNVEQESTSYIPAIPILSEPSTFMALVPADKAIAVANSIKAKYEQEMGKVRNRLPLTLGLVFAGSRTPLPAILDAGRRMLKQSIKPEQVKEPKTWEVVEKQLDKVDHSRRSQEIKLMLKNSEGTIQVSVPTMMGDRTTQDVWYPYWCVKKDSQGNQPSGRNRQFTGIDGKQWVHINDLKAMDLKTGQAGDEVQFMPSRFDFEFLDTTARRFEISYEKGKRRGISRPARPYYLEQLDEFEELWEMLSKNMATSQIHNLIGSIETKRTEWAGDQSSNDSQSAKTAFEQFVHSTLYNAEWKLRPSKDDINLLHSAAVSGQLADVVELYISILKQPIKADKQGGNL